MSVPEVEFVLDEPPLSAEALERLDGVLTGCALAIAETGTIILDGGPRSGRRIISLIPDLHICLVERTKIVATVPDALATLASDGRQVSPLTFVSGPSATVDIGFERVEGVHGPRRLIVVLVP
jgi:L-lactate dehydrogenase complex protein LldG